MSKMNSKTNSTKKRALFHGMTEGFIKSSLLFLVLMLGLLLAISPARFTSYDAYSGVFDCGFYLVAGGIMLSGALVALLVRSLVGAKTCRAMSNIFGLILALFGLLTVCNAVTNTSIASKLINSLYNIENAGATGSVINPTWLLLIPCLALVLSFAFKYDSKKKNLGFAMGILVAGVLVCTLGRLFARLVFADYIGCAECGIYFSFSRLTSGSPFMIGLSTLAVIAGIALAVAYILPMISEKSSKKK